eukprot:CAMPEP_0204826600 /NCGR_PEP_ID=MMETSP1346-20131115/4258_1 /ASSEMBLY_ACC=CAM_ASM_000771 /TAXON_ID=215587 /ORGANISM="Aplanochytrium stocchinoi, Strain GSBS06" /LENGTH=80 /DNA_ID=CAMNT_0051954695 /DNA_START=182 /DNA_END=424 /DNA_ORIENTATION=-
MVIGCGTYAVVSYTYGAVSRARAPAHEEPKQTPKAAVKAAPAPAKPATPANSPALDDNALEILKDVQTRLIKIEKIFNLN